MRARIADGAAPLAEVVRGGLVESVHLGHLVVVDPAGDVVQAVGEPTAEIWARSSLKPLQAVAMLRAGLTLPDPLLALAAASHNGEPRHLEGARAILAGAGLGPEALRNTPDLPLHAPSALAWQQAGHGAERITQNCSGKHAAMLATCVAAGWPTETYLEPDHPLQRAVRAAVVELTGDDPARTRVTVDGCGAPLFSSSLVGLARAFGRLAAAGRVPDDGTPVARVARAMAAHPEMVAGVGREDTLAMQAVPGLVAKIGAEGVCAAGLPDGGAVAFKILDGSSRPRPAILAGALLAAGAAEVPGADAAALAEVGSTPVLGGGRPVGEVRAVVGPPLAEALPAGGAA
ncbi:asparaginase [Isoptericola variabilis]|uniref:asparaginase n=1 Tax=Isoptericola variabilis TaxID=139208 RepID=UPI001E3EB465|nr:asparaginase [Isoptericola variabilis]